MFKDKMYSVMKNFSEDFLFELLGDLKDSLLEWSIDRELVSKKNMIDIIISVYGVSLFTKSDFLYNFYVSMEDTNALKEIAVVFGVYKNGKQFDQEKIAKSLSKKKFSENEGYKYLIYNYLDLADYKFEVKNKEANIEEVGRVSDKPFYELYDYQYMIKQQAINDLSNKNKVLYKILLHMPTGTGKTKTAMHIIAHYLNFVTKGKGLVIWIAHSDELLQQAYETFLSVWQHLALFKVTVYKGWVAFPSEICDGILFTSIQGLQRKVDKPIFEELTSKASLVVFDEVHKAGAIKYRRCVDLLMKHDNEYGKKFIGLTATPGRAVDNHKANRLFAEEFDKIIGIDVDKINLISLTENEAANYSGSKEPIIYFQENKYLAKLLREVIKFELDTDVYNKIKSEYFSKRDDYSEDLIKQISLNKSRNILIVDKLKELHNKHIPTIVFACSLQHAKMLSAFLRILDIENSLVYGEMDPYERKNAISNFKNGVVDIIINYEILTTGFDSTNIQCVFITRPTKSVILYSQMIGRGLRGPKMGGNEYCKLIDIDDNISKFADENSAFKYFNNYWR